MKTNRGFELHYLTDSCGTEYTLQESSAALMCTVDGDIEGPFVWLGVNHPTVKIMYQDAKDIGLDLPKIDPDTGPAGWCIFPMPKHALIESRVHLTQDQARELAQRLLFFADNGYLEPLEENSMKDGVNN